MEQSALQVVADLLSHGSNKGFRFAMKKEGFVLDKYQVMQKAVFRGRLITSSISNDQFVLSFFLELQQDASNQCYKNTLT